MKPKIKVLIADDHHIFRRGIISILKDEEMFELIAEAADGNEALEKIRTLKPDIALLDLDMPGLNGLEIAKTIYTEHLPVKTAILTMHKEKEYFTGAMEVNVKAFLLKDTISDDLIECLKTIAEGNYYISPQISTYLVEKKEQPAWLKKLTQTEINVLRLVAENKTSPQIAKELFNSVRTIENHRNNICKKLGLSGQHALLLFAAENKKYL
jgi:DNA-binding NarL/FixJ family response regulator